MNACVSNTLFPGLVERSVGVWLHPTVLPSRTGVGNWGAPAYQWIDFLKSAGVRYWQMCPLGPTTYSNSPYQCSSAFAGNPYLIDLEALVQQGLLPDLGPLTQLPQDRVDYGALYAYFWPLLERAWQAFEANPRLLDPTGTAYPAFLSSQAHWLDAFCRFAALKIHFKQAPFTQWPSGWQTYAQAKARADWPAAVEAGARLQAFCQFVFHTQWAQLRAYAQDQGVQILGDVALFVGPDSADLWTHPELFYLDAQGRQTQLAGYPPDYFSETGQFWQNPLYRWGVHRQTGYAWWMARLAHGLQLCDALRLDHFQGFDRYWSIPQGAADARAGEWQPGPGLEFFQTLQKRFPQGPFIVEDLGQFNPSAAALKEAVGLPGMAVLQFAFGDGGPQNPYLPHNLGRNTVLYTGTHDTDTLWGFLQTLTPSADRYLKDYLGVETQEGAHQALLRSAYASVAQLAILPVQDLLQLGSWARFNRPGTPSGNWEWRLSPQALSTQLPQMAPQLRRLGAVYGRISKF